VINYEYLENNLTREKVMDITKKELELIDDWVLLYQEIEKLEDELDSLSRKLKKINNKLYAKKPKVELEEFRDFLAKEIKKLNKKIDKDRIKQLFNLKTIVEHDINIDNLVEQDIDIKEKELNIDLKDYKKK
jgi:hypothetical protein